MEILLGVEQGWEMNRRINYQLINSRCITSYVEVGLMEGHRLSFKQSDPRTLSTLNKNTAKMVDSTPSAVALEPITKEK